MNTPNKRDKSYIPSDFDTISVSVASPEQILNWSYGEVTKPETINYRTQKPERDGLFCEKIFGPTKNWECYCGKYKKIRYKNVVCDKCGVEVTRSSVRRERMGHIKLAVPVTHIWFLRSTPSRIGLLLNLPIKTLEQVVYFASYIIQEVDHDAKAGATEELEKDYKQHKNRLQKDYKDQQNQLELDQKLNANQKKKMKDQLRDSSLKDFEELAEAYEQAREDLKSIERFKVISELKYRDLSMKFGHVFKAGIGAEAIRECIESINLETLSQDIKAKIKKSSGQKKKKLTKRLMLAGSLVKADIKPEWMILSILPVIPPDLRPMVQLDGGRFAASDLNDLYRRIINRNNRLKRLLEIGAPEVICRNEKRMLQEAVDALINNSARAGRAVTKTGYSRLQLKSLSDMLKGKQGRFRQNLLGKRVDYSGRSVIVVGPNLKLHQCGIPKKMALELFKPFVIGKLLQNEQAHNLKNAEKLIEWGRPEVWDALEEITKNQYVLLNRAPTLHRLGIQAFQPVLIEGKAIQLHPLVCSAFNADFDGDQMAVHVPLSKHAQREAGEIMLSAKNLLKPSSGEPIISPSQDMILGCYYLTHISANAKLKPFIFCDINEAITAYRKGFVTLQDKIKARIKGEIIETSVGRMIFNSFLHEALGYRNIDMTKKALKEAISDCYEKVDIETTAQLADQIKRIGFKFASKSGLSLSISDLQSPKNKDKVIDETNEIIAQITKQYRKGLMTDDERYQHTIKSWATAKNRISESLVDEIDREGTVFTMVNSGARGNWGQITQIAGIKGLVANPAGKTIELPIKSNFREGFSPLEYFIATHGGRKGKSDTALKTAGAGYLTRRLVDAVQDVVVREQDCGSTSFVTVTRKESEEIGEAFENRIFGRTLAADVADPKTGEIIAEKGQAIDWEVTRKIHKAQVNELYVRSIMTCLTINGVCQKCYGRDLATSKTVELGTPVGIIAAQSIGEPGTQLTMRTFHSGGVAEGKDITQGLPRVEELFEARSPKTQAYLAEISGEVKMTRKGQIAEIEIVADKLEEDVYELKGKCEAIVKVGDSVKEKEVVARSADKKETVKALNQGKVVKVSEDFIVIKQTVKPVRTYSIPAKEGLRVGNKDHVYAGQALTEGHLNLQDLILATNILTAQKYVMREVQSIYASQGQSINDKHIEIIVKQMFSKARVTDPGDTELLPGQVVNFLTLEQTNAALAKKKKKLAKFDRLLLGLTRISLNTESWLAAASFQETIRVLVEASVTKRLDTLEGLKENVIIGKLIRAGQIYRDTYCKE
ncbi:MAG: DNA-directed RNA polymerase subunit beta' [Candidatus Gracilibacteria bacterium]|nr:DNA-directed RNA polymerase subunit beta' [Candidatus Gracilibacteria bacterium]